MGKHSGGTQLRDAGQVPTVAHARTLPAPSRTRPAPSSAWKRRRTVLCGFAMLACASFAFVTAVAPASGASASPYYQAPATQTAAAGVQSFKIDGGYVLVDVKRDTYTVHQDTPAIAGLPGSNAPTVPSGTAQAYAASLVAGHGWGGDQFTCLVQLWNRESGWNSKAANPSGAYGIPQALPGSKMGPGWDTDYRVQVRWGIQYIAARYGSPCGAWNSEISRGSY